MFDMGNGPYGGFMKKEFKLRERVTIQNTGSVL